MSEHSYKLKKKEIILLTPMRGIAALIVVFYHARLHLPNLSFGFIFERSYLWVDFFFILSGFIISYVYRDSFLKTKEYRDFFIARFARIYPLHFFMLILFILWESSRFFIPTNFEPFTTPDRTVFAIFTNLFLIQSWGIHDTLTWNHPAWSISTEWAAYLVFPIIAIISKSWKENSHLLAVLIILITLTLISYFNGSLDITYNYGLVRCILEFSLGMSIYYFFTQNSKVKFFNNNLTILFTLIATFIFISIPNLARYDFFIIYLFAILVLSLANYEEGIFSKIIGNRFIKMLGDTSYSIYLTHTFVLTIIFEISKRIFSSADFALKFNLLDSIVYFTIVTIITIIFSYTTYYYLEIPARIYLKKLLIKNKN